MDPLSRAVTGSYVRIFLDDRCPDDPNGQVSGADVQVAALIQQQNQPNSNERFSAYSAFQYQLINAHPDRYAMKSHHLLHQHVPYDRYDGRNLRRYKADRS